MEAKNSLPLSSGREIHSTSTGATGPISSGFLGDQPPGLHCNPPVSERDIRKQPISIFSIHDIEVASCQLNRHGMEFVSFSLLLFFPPAGLQCFVGQSFPSSDGFGCQLETIGWQVLCKQYLSCKGRKPSLFQHLHHHHHTLQPACERKKSHAKPVQSLCGLRPSHQDGLETRRIFA